MGTRSGTRRHDGPHHSSVEGSGDVQLPGNAQVPRITLLDAVVRRHGRQNSLLGRVDENKSDHYNYSVRCVPIWRPALAYPRMLRSICKLFGYPLGSMALTAVRSGRDDRQCLRTILSRSISEGAGPHSTHTRTSPVSSTTTSRNGTVGLFTCTQNYVVAMG